LNAWSQPDAQVSDLSWEGNGFRSSRRVQGRVDGEIRYVSLGFRRRILRPDGRIRAAESWQHCRPQGILIARRPLSEGVDLVGQPTIPEVLAH